MCKFYLFCIKYIRHIKDKYIYTTLCHFTLHFILNVSSTRSSDNSTNIFKNLTPLQFTLKVPNSITKKLNRFVYDLFSTILKILNCIAKVSIHQAINITYLLQNIKAYSFPKKIH